MMMIMLEAYGTLMMDLVPPWPPEAPQDLAQHEQQQSSSSPSFTAFHVTMIFVAIVLCVIICAIPWDTMKCCSGSRNEQQQQSASEVTDEEEAREGLSKKVIRSFKIVRYGSSSTKWGGKEELGSATECMICLSDFRNGQRIRLLPECNHGFHKRCIDQWLLSHSSCPICRNPLFLLQSPEKSVNHHHHRQHHQQQLQQTHDVVPVVAVAAASDHHVESEDHSAANNVYRTYVVISD